MFDPQTLLQATHTMPRSILSAYDLNEDQCIIEAFGTGLINHTWKVSHGSRDFILQRINNSVFPDPLAIAENMVVIQDFLRIHSPDYLFVNSIATKTGAPMHFEPGKGYFRLLPFIADSFTYDVVKSPMIAYEAAKQFGTFTKKLADLDISLLKTTLPDFHNLTLRYQQFESALETATTARMKLASFSIKTIIAQKGIVSTFEAIRQNPDFKLRVTHHDTKISNVLFNAEGKGLCVIDLDTTMPGYFISDAGDMMRTYLSPVSEEERNLSAINIREAYFVAVAEGYLNQMKTELSEIELEHFVYSGEFMIYMQALRFLTDYLENDRYYGSKYPDHNLVRTQNQLELLDCFQQKKTALAQHVEALLHMGAS